MNLRHWLKNKYVMYRIGRLVLKSLGLKNVPLPTINDNFYGKCVSLTGHHIYSPFRLQVVNGNLYECKSEHVVQKYIQLSSLWNYTFTFCGIYTANSHKVVFPKA